MSRSRIHSNVINDALWGQYCTLMLEAEHRVALDHRLAALLEWQLKEVVTDQIKKTKFF